MKPLRIVAAAILISIISGCSSNYAYVQEGKPHAEANVRAVSQHWDADALLAAADPRMLQGHTTADVRNLVAAVGNGIGTVRQQKTLFEGSRVETAIPGMTADYGIELDGDRGKALVKIKLQKEGAQWKVLGFWAVPKTDAAPASGH